MRRIRATHFLLPLVAAAMTACASHAAAGEMERPNIILCMTDDQGWGDASYNGHPILKTPNLDAMAAQGIRFTRFYAAAPVCSPTRGSCLTGRHPYRYGIFGANVGHIPAAEVTLAEVLREHGYATGHFGKWHLGTLTATEKESNRGGPRGKAHYSPPWENGFDVCFSTEAKVPTCDPMRTPGGDKPYGTCYWTGPGEKVTANLDGDDSRIIMDRAIPFISAAVEEQKPFFAVIWFHAPHLPVVAGEKHRKPYAELPDDMQHYFGCIAAMDEQMGRLRSELKRLGVERNTMLWYCSDNGPERAMKGKGGHGSAGPLRARKRSLFEGGVRVPGLLIWPAKIDTPRTVNIPACTSDYFPTIIDALGIIVSSDFNTIDGLSLMPLIEGDMTERPAPIAFQSRKQRSLIGNRYKLISQDDGKRYMLFDIIEDPAEKTDIAPDHSEIAATMRRQLDAWIDSCRTDLQKHKELREASK